MPIIAAYKRTRRSLVRQVLEARFGDFETGIQAIADRLNIHSYAVRRELIKPYPSLDWLRIVRDTINRNSNPLKHALISVEDLFEDL